MYPEDVSNSALFSHKRPLPITPPLSTRRATAEILGSASVRCVTFASFLYILHLTAFCSGSIPMEQEDVAQAKELEIPFVFFILIFLIYVTDPSPKIEEAKEDPRS
jgi:hypothetical protein